MMYDRQGNVLVWSGRIPPGDTVPYAVAVHDEYPEPRRSGQGEHHSLAHLIRAECTGEEGAVIKSCLKTYLRLGEYMPQERSMQDLRREARDVLYRIVNGLHKI